MMHTKMAAQATVTCNLLECLGWDMTVCIMHSTTCSTFHIEATCQGDVARQSAATDEYHYSTGAHLTSLVASWQQEGARQQGEQA